MFTFAVQFFSDFIWFSKLCNLWTLAFACDYSCAEHVFCSNLVICAVLCYVFFLCCNLYVLYFGCTQYDFVLKFQTYSYVPSVILLFKQFCLCHVYGVGLCLNFIFVQAKDLALSLGVSTDMCDIMVLQIWILLF